MTDEEELKRKLKRRGILRENARGQRKTIFERDNYTCRYCDVQFLPPNDSLLAVDHFKPLDVNEKKNNKHRNLLTACRRCNSLKGHRKFKTIEEVRQWVPPNCGELLKV